MIEAKDIRIGHLYYLVREKGKTVIEITPEIMGKIFSDSNEYALNDFEPIPISRDDLLDIGFKLSNLNTLNINLNGVFLDFNGSSGYLRAGTLHHFYVGYIHEVQDIINTKIFQK